MQNKDIKNWIVIVGRPIYGCRTRKQARAFIKQQCKDTKYPNFNYIGKCGNNYRKIILDV